MERNEDLKMSGFTFDFAEPESNTNQTSTTIEVPKFDCKLHDIKEGLINEITNFTAENAIDIEEQNVHIIKRSLSDITYEIAVDQMEDNQQNKSIVQSIVQSMSSQSDLISGIYEGGAKTWECSIDLVNFLNSNWTKLLQTYKLDDTKPLKVLELGCGSALPGIYCLKYQNCETVFQDYNEDVIKMVTIPNVGLNLSFSKGEKLTNLDDVPVNRNQLIAESKTQFISGDWSKMDNLNTGNQAFDLILTSETIYSASSHQQLLNAMAQNLRPDGIALVAAKTTYFGCSGSLAMFLRQAEQHCRVQQIECLLTVSDAGVRREIVMLRF